MGNHHPLCPSWCGAALPAGHVLSFVLWILQNETIPNPWVWGHISAILKFFDSMFSFYFQHTSCFEGLMSSIPNYWVFFFPAWIAVRGSERDSCGTGQPKHFHEGCYTFSSLLAVLSFWQTFLWTNSQKRWWGANQREYDSCQKGSVFSVWTTAYEHSFSHSWEL